MNTRLLHAIALVAALTALADEPKGKTTMKRLVYKSDFVNMDDFWAEGGEGASVEDGRLHQKANPPEKGPGYVSTIWCRKPMPENVEVHFKACVLASVTGVNNINFFLHYRHPKGLFETQEERADGGYKRYHGLDGYIFTFLRDTKGEPNADGKQKARGRMRRCPGFKLIDETFQGTCEVGQVYEIMIRKVGGQLSYWVDGKKILEAVDPKPLPGGLLGFRTFRTHLWWSDLRVFDLGKTPQAKD